MNSLLIVISGHDVDDLKSRCETVLTSLDDHANLDADLADLAARLGVVTPGALRVGLIVRDRHELRASLSDFLRRLPELADDPTGAGRWYGGWIPDHTRIAFVFPGQGAQRVGEHATLARLSPAFGARCRELLEDSQVAGLEGLLTSGWDDAERDPQATADAIRRTDAAQTLLSVLGVATTDLLASVGICPHSVMGHSVGEFPALYAAGGLEAPTAVELASVRGRIMREQIGHGDFGMIALRCDFETAEAMASGIDDVYLTCSNSGQQTVFGGTAAALARFAERCRAEAVVATPIPAQGPFHTPLVASSQKAFAAVAHGAPIHGPHRRFVSTVSGVRETDPDIIGDLLARQITAPVDFRAAGHELLTDDPDIVIQVCGGDSLLKFLQNDHPDSRFLAVGFGAGNDNAEEVSRSFAQLFVRVPQVQLSPVLSRGVAAGWRLRDVRHDRQSLMRADAITPDMKVAWPEPESAARPSPSVVRNALHPPEPASVTGLHDARTVREALLEAMSQASGSPVAELVGGGRLAEDLGFDSLLMMDTLRRLSARFPDLMRPDLDLTAAKTLDDWVCVLSQAPGGERPALATSAIEETALPDRCERSLESLPELAAFDETRRLFKLSGSFIPYYLPHDGIISNTTSIEASPFLSFSSYNYLALSEHDEVQGAAIRAIQQYGTSVSAARILSGNRPLHDDLEREIAEFIGAEDAVVLVGGHATNASIIPQVVKDDDIVLHDALAHDSIQQGVKASGAVRHSFPHNDLGALTAALRRRRGNFRRALICVEGAYSMDGDTAPLADLVDLKDRYGAILMVDEAHSFGVVGPNGRGICEAEGVDPNRVDILMGTLSKAMASCGGYLAGSHRFVEFLRYNLSGLVFSAGLSPANTAAALAALRVLRREPERVKRLHRNADRFRRGVDALGLDWGHGSGTPIVPIIYGDSQKTLAVSNALYRGRISINPILAPAVAEHLTRLRVFVTAAHTKEQIDRALAAIAEVSEIRMTA